MSKERNVDDAELEKVSGAGGGNVHVEATEDALPEPPDPPRTIPLPIGGGGGGGASPDGLENDADTGGDQELNRD